MSTLVPRLRISVGQHFQPERVRFHKGGAGQLPSVRAPVGILLAEAVALRKLLVENFPDFLN